MSDNATLVERLNATGALWTASTVSALRREAAARIAELEGEVANLKTLKGYTRLVELEALVDTKHWRIAELEAMTVRLCDIAKVYMTQEAWLRFDADVRRSVFGR
jgi:hypothetical protein